MLPSLVNAELEAQLREFLSGTFAAASPRFNRADGNLIGDFLTQREKLVKGPYLSLGLPFRKDEARKPAFQNLELPYTPYLHQSIAFDRLLGESPKSTLIATGTGSGKTECFLLPALDHCAGDSRPGVKVIVIYPMNALAMDQAARFAAEIHQRDALRGKVTVGLYTGETESSPHKRMTATHVVTCKNTLQENPPDILLTNYKMLDFLLLRPKDQRLWQHNRPGMLRYLVVDELHTFDGAQGTDLACLLRRLCFRLQCDNQLACIGTSATVGGEDAETNLLQYATEVFNTPFATDSVIREDRLSVAEFMQLHRDGPVADENQWPLLRDLPRIDAMLLNDRDTYLRRAASAWGLKLPPGSVVGGPALGAALLKHSAVEELLERLTAAGGLLDVNTLAEDWQQSLGMANTEQAMTVINSLLALIAAARLPDTDDTPLFQLRLQVWLRELARMVASVAAVPQLCHSDDVPDLSNPLHLPVVSCRECQTMGWGAVIDPAENTVGTALQAFYAAWFNHHPDTRMLIPVPTEYPRADSQALCTSCGHLSGSHRDQCAACGDESLLRVWVPDMRVVVQNSDVVRERRSNRCPSCSAEETLFVVGVRTASLASAVLSRSMSSRYNPDRKVIAFSDNVQDAAHRAGYFTARTWGQLIRIAVSEYLQSPGGRAATLAEAIAEIGPFWRDRIGNDAEFCGRFMPPNLLWWSDYKELEDTGKLLTGSNLPRDVCARLGWELLAQFTLEVRKGTALEKQGASIAGFRQSQVEAAAVALLPRIQASAGCFADLAVAELVPWIGGILTRMRLQGGVLHPAYEGYIHDGGNPFLIGRQAYMPAFGPASTLPLFPSINVRGGRVRFPDMAAESRWYADWLKVCLGGSRLVDSGITGSTHELLFNALAQADIVVHKDTRHGGKVWALDPGALHCSTQPRFWRCSDCGHIGRSGPEEVSLWEGRHCMQLAASVEGACSGHYSAMAAPTAPHGLAGDTVRVLAKEHTALIGGEEREQVERSFKRKVPDRGSWDVNVLSATPTLEMGIDIGDLSTVMLCSVPPRQASYLQRIGRAGRTDGNAFNCTMATGSNHDLYFYEEPREMMSGAVDTPGVFLSAGAVLERQALAFCMDCWAAAGADESALPTRMKSILNALEAGTSEGFPFNLLTFINDNRKQLLADFGRLFKALPSESLRKIERFIAISGDNTLGERLITRLHTLLTQRRSHSARVDDLKRSIEKLEKQPQDEARDEALEGALMERGAYQKLIGKMNGQSCLEFFTDEGLLPNYAFPEAGVTLQSVLVRRTQESDTGDSGAGHTRYETQVLEIQRPASAALSEFAPQSWFYGVERRVRIEQIDLKVSPISAWRFCDSCNFSMPLDAGDNYSSCPRCGSVVWGNVSQQMPVVRLTQVVANTDDARSRIGDDSDSREPLFYHRQTLVQIESTAEQAWRLKRDELPFAFEYQSKVNIRDFNFGQPVNSDIEPNDVAGQTAQRPGFRVCRHCGKLDANWLRFRHAWDCPVSTERREPTALDWESIVLFRELQSEAVRILLPVTHVAESESVLASLIAGIELGLKLYFRGNVDHLRVLHHSDVGEAGGLPRQYLVLYDSVPGGTAYLKELMQKPENMFALLQLALTHMQDCGCNADTAKDGCYRCLFAYRRQRDQRVMSRDAACELIERILEARTDIESIDTVADVDINSLLESKLEERVVSALRQCGAFNVAFEVVNGKPGYSVIPKGDNSSSAYWVFEPQVEFGPAQGFSKTTRADAVLWPRAHASGVRPIVLYADGFAPHWDQVTDDVLKRLPIQQSGKYRVWTLTWKDLPPISDEARHAATTVLRKEGPSAGVFDQRLRQLGINGWDFTRTTKEIGNGPFQWLVDLLVDPAQGEQSMQVECASRLYGWIDPAAKPGSVQIQALSYELAENLPESLHEQFLPSATRQVLVGGTMNAFLGHESDVEIVCGVDADDMKSGIAGGAVAVCLDDRNADASTTFESVWREFWAANVLFQFADRIYSTTRSGVESGLFDHLQRYADQPEVESETVAEWRKLTEYSDLARLIGEAHWLYLPVPVVGYELTNSDKVVIGELELAWESKKVCFVMDSEAKSIAEGLGWISTVVSTLDAAISFLKEQGLYDGSN